MPNFQTPPAISPKALAVAREMVKTKEGALKLLQGAGILDADGNHTDPYKEPLDTAPLILAGS